MKKHSLMVFLIISLEVFFSFFRDFVFTNVNAQGYKVFYKDPTINVDSWMSFTENMSYMDLYYLKWFLTIVFSFVFFLLTLFSVNYLFTKKKYNKITLLSYLTLFAISGLSIILGILFKPLEDEAFVFSRYLMHIAQSPITLMILVPAFYLAEHSQE